MTTTAAPPSLPPSAPPRVPPPPDRPRRRRPLRVLAVAAVLGIVALTTTIGGEAGHDMPMADPPPSDAAGTYRLDDGAHLTVWGSAHHPIAEVDGRMDRLVADGQDRYRSVDDTAVLRFVRDGDEVDGVRLERVGAPARSGHRVALHVEEPVTFRSGAVELAGTVFTPLGEGPHPAVVIVHGAEFTDRDTYRLLASHLARSGVAALIYDKHR